MWQNTDAVDFERKGGDFAKKARKDEKRKRKAEFSDIDDAVYKWYYLGQERNIPLSGPIQEKARLNSERFENSHFKASNGWLQSFKACHNLKGH